MNQAHNNERRLPESILNLFSFHDMNWCECDCDFTTMTAGPHDASVLRTRSVTPQSAPVTNHDTIELHRAVEGVNSSKRDFFLSEWVQGGMGAPPKIIAI